MMDGHTKPEVQASSYDRDACECGVVHLGFGAFHRAHQAAYIDAYMQHTGDLRWGIAAVNLRGSESDIFATAAAEINDFGGYYMKAISPDNQVVISQIRPHIAFADWASDKAGAESLVSQESVHLVTITVTESGYYCDPQGDLDLSHPVISAELTGDSKETVYAYLRAALKQRQEMGLPLTIACCDNIRQNGKMLERNLNGYLRAAGEDELADWVAENIAFPCSMVDRITPRSPDTLAAELSTLLNASVASPILCEDYLQWVLADNAASAMPDLAKVDVTVTSDVDPFEETKIRVLNGGHTALAYLAALEGLHTFDEAMRHPELRAHFDKFEQEEVLPALTLALPFEKDAYQEKIAQRFSNQAIGDTVARICADGMAKFPIFIRPTLEGCFAQGIIPHHTIHSIASWYVFAKHVAAGKVSFSYNEPSWDELHAMLGTDAFHTSEQLWGNIPTLYPDFITLLQQQIAHLEEKWPA